MTIAPDYVCVCVCACVCRGVISKWNVTALIRRKIATSSWFLRT
jgi:hypothetical protein